MEIYEEFFPDSDAETFTKFVKKKEKYDIFISFVFNAFDEKNTEELTFLEFLQALSLHSKGKPHDKLERNAIF